MNRPVGLAPEPFAETLIVEAHEPEMKMSRARQISRTWPSHLAWHLYNALGLRGMP